MTSETPSSDQKDGVTASEEDDAVTSAESTADDPVDVSGVPAKKAEGSRWLTSPLRAARRMLSTRSVLWKLAAVVLAAGSPFITFRVGQRLAEEATSASESTETLYPADPGVLVFLDSPRHDVDVSLWVGPNLWTVQLSIVSDEDDLDTSDFTAYVAFADGFHLDTSDYRNVLEIDGVEEVTVQKNSNLEEFLMPVYGGNDGNLYSSPSEQELDAFYARRYPVQLFKVTLNTRDRYQAGLQGRPGWRATASTSVGRDLTVPAIQNWAYRCTDAKNNGAIDDNFESDPSSYCPPIADFVLAVPPNDDAAIDAINRMYNNGNVQVHEAPDPAAFAPNFDTDSVMVSLNLPPGWSVSWTSSEPNTPMAFSDPVVSDEPFWNSAGLNSFRGVDVQLQSQRVAQQAQQKSLYAGIFLGVAASVLTSALLAAAGWMWRRGAARKSRQTSATDSSADGVRSDSQDEALTTT